jgi:hypothetical protein
MDIKEIKPLIAERFSKPILLLWTIILPQALLVLINLSSWSLIKGEASEIQRRMAFQIFVLEVIILLSGIVILGIFQYLKRRLNLIVCALLFFAHIAYLWLLTSWMHKLLPDSVTIWILPPDQVIYYQYILMMPAVFYTGLRLACFKLPVDKVKDVSITVATLIIVPLCSYLFTTVFFRLFWDWDIPSIILTTLFIGATVITMMAFLRTLTFIYLRLNNYKAGHIVLLLAVGLAGPLGGLALNSQIPFPCDFQSLFVYILAVANGLILLLNFKEGTKREVLGWFLRCLMYPFSLYFFLVFLPFLPLSLIAMIAAGSGFLILAPTALFIVHTRKLIDEGKRVANLLGWKIALLLFAVGFAVMPAIISAGALSDRHSLMQAIDAVYSPDYTKDIEIKPESVKRSLLKLRDMKDGIFLPFISTYYNKVVFNGMVLPDHKMNDMYLMFFGQEMPKDESPDRFGFGRRMDFRNRPVVMPERNVKLSDVMISQEQDGEFVRANIQLTLTNKGAEQSEFVTNIQLGRGVMISGYWLNVGDEKVAGRIFEKKAAMWIYHMIRDITHRDPGLLIYKTNDLLKLSVYPFALDEQRITGIELLYPAGMSPSVKIGDKQLEIESNEIAEPEVVLLAKLRQGSTTAIISGKALNALPAVRRKPYLHFIVDNSMNAEDVFGSFGKTMADVAGKYVKANECKITLANYEFSDLTDGLVNSKEIDNIMKNSASKSLDFEGAFCYRKAIKQKLIDFLSVSATGPDNEFTVPIFVIVKAPDSNTVSIGEMSPFGRIIPDVEKYYIAKEDGRLIAKGFNGKETVESEIETSAPVVLIKYGDSVRACVKNSGWGFGNFLSADGSVLEVYNEETEGFVAIKNVKVLDNDTAYAKGLAVWEKYRDTVYAPYTITDMLPEIVKMSKDCGIIVPSTSYIVLENSAQLEMLKRKEKQGLSANQALEFDEFLESPAPPVIFLTPFALILISKLRRRKN